MGSLLVCMGVLPRSGQVLGPQSSELHWETRRHFCGMGRGVPFSWQTQSHGRVCSLAISSLSSPQPGPLVGYARCTAPGWGSGKKTKPRLHSFMWGLIKKSFHQEAKGKKTFAPFLLLLEFMFPDITLNTPMCLRSCNG